MDNIDGAADPGVRLAAQDRRGYRVVRGVLRPDDGSWASWPVRASGRLQARTERVYDDELAAIEDAIARIDDGMYGMCEGCDLAMPDEWLADKPEVQCCPDCSLRRAVSQ